MVSAIEGFHCICNSGLCSRHRARQSILAEVTGYVVVVSLCETDTSEAAYILTIKSETGGGLSSGVTAIPNTNVQNNSNHQIKLLCNYI